MSVIIYVYGKCSTCKEALHYLQKNSISIEKHEITSTPPSLAHLQLMLKYQDGAIQKLFNTSGILYRDLHLAEKLPRMSLEESLQLLHTQGMLVKRPFVLGHDFGLLGFKENQWRVHFE